MIAAVEAGFDVGRRRRSSGRASRRRSRRRCALATRVNQYVSDAGAVGRCSKTDRERAATILYVALRCVDSLKVLFTPFLPFSSQALHELLGYDGWIAGPLEFREVDERGRRAAHGADGRLRLVGRPLGAERAPARPGLCAKPTPLFEKLDPETVVADELARMRGAAAA